MDLCAINNEIQVPQHEANTGDADLQEAREEVAEALTTRDRETMQPNRNRMRLGELQDERKAVASFIKTIPSRLAAHNERFRDDLNTLVTTYSTDLTTDTDIRPTVAVVGHAQEAARAHSERLATPHPQLPASRLDPIPLSSPQPH